MTFLLLIRCTHKEFRVPSLCRPLVTYCFLTLEIKRYRTLTSFVLLKDADSIFSFNLQRNKGLFNFIQVKTSFSPTKGQRLISLSFFSFIGRLNSLIASLVMNFVPFLALFVFAPIDLPSDLPGERDWSKLVLFLFREWFRLHFDSSSTAAANHSVSKPNHKATPRLKHRLTGPFLIGFRFRNATSIRRWRKKH